MKEIFRIAAGVGMMGGAVVAAMVLPATDTFSAVFSISLAIAGFVVAWEGFGDLSDNNFEIKRAARSVQPS